METPFSDPSFPKLFSGYERKRPIRRQRKTLPTAPWRGGGGGWSDISREGECRIARRSKILQVFCLPNLRSHTTVGAKVFHSCLHVRIADLFEKLPSTSSKVRVYLPRLPGSTPDLRGDPPRDFRSRCSSRRARSHGSKHQLWNPPLERGPSLPTSCPRRKPCFEANHDVRVKPNERVERTNQDE